jgi:uncharacterized membrane protein YdjX (TVP38/TMEM64 family)
MLRLIAVFVGLGVLFLIPFFIWGDLFDAALTREGSIAWMESFGPLGWLAGIGLLVSDLVVPIPSTIIMSALGYVYGAVLGGLLATLGSCLSGLLGYFLCRCFGIRVAARLVGEGPLAEMELTFRQMGGWLVVLSRWLPLFPEVVACMAGLARMPLPIFGLALVCGSLPLGLVFALIGSLGVSSPLSALALSAVLPPLLWLTARRLLGR